MKKIVNASEAVVPLRLATARVELLKPDAYILASKVEGEEWQAVTLGRLDEGIAKMVAGTKKRMLQENGKPFELRLERLTVVLHETSCYIN